MQKKIAIRLSGSGHLFEKSCQLFEWLKLSVQNKIVLCWNSSGYLSEKNCRPFEQLGLSVRKKLAVIQKLDPAICLKKNLARFPSQNNFLASHLCRMICYSPGILEWSHYELCLQTYHEQSHLFFYPCLICFVIHSATPFRTAWLPLPHLFACHVFVYRALFKRNIFE